MRVAAIQLGGSTDDLLANHDAVCAALREAASAGAELAVLPELAGVPYFCAGPAGAYRGWSESVDGPVVTATARCCAELRLAALLPFFERGANGTYHNSAMLIDAKGRRVVGRGLRGPVEVARKLHLPTGPGGDEARHFAPGDDLAVFGLGPLRLGCLMCYDRRFPECWRAMRALGAELVAVPVAGASGEDDAFFLGELRTHARENGLAVVCAAKAGPERLGTMTQIHPGGSSVIGADGTVLARCGNFAGPDLAVAEIARPDVVAARRALPLFENRRREVLALAARLSDEDREEHRDA